MVARRLVLSHSVQNVHSFVLCVESRGFEAFFTPHTSYIIDVWMNCEGIQVGGVVAAAAAATEAKKIIEK